MKNFQNMNLQNSFVSDFINFNFLILGDVVDDRNKEACYD